MRRPIVSLPKGSSVTPSTSSRTGDWCMEQQPSGALGSCWRPLGHGGRHAFIDHRGRVIAVWGVDVHAAARARRAAS